MTKCDGPDAGPSFSLRNRAGRALWYLVCLLCFRPSPRPMHAWRSWLLRLFGARMGTGCHIYPGATVWAPWNLECGDHVAVADGVTLYNQGRIVLGARVAVSSGSHLCTGTHDYEAPDHRLVTAPIVVGARAWVCAEVFILPGVTIGEGAVIGARSLVTRDMPAWTVCAGHPCKPLKPRVIREG